MSVPLSVFIIAHNEEARIGRTIESVLNIADEVVVVDSGSTDKTKAIAEKLGAKVFHRDWTGYGPQKSFAEGKCSNNWVLNLDADEVLTEDLQREISVLFAQDALSSGAFDVRILTVYPGASKPRPFANDYTVVRLYDRAVARYSDHPVYDRVVVDDGVQIQHLKAPILHHTMLDLHQMVDKGNRLSSHQIDGMVKKHRLLLRVRLFIEFPLVFVRNYLLRGHIWGGAKGFVFALNAAFLRTMRVAKILERQEQIERNE